MNRHSKIELLLQHFFEGKTTLEEEQELADFFKGNDIPEHLKKYRPLFKMYSAEAAVRTTTELQFSEPSVPWYRRELIRRFAVAASVMLLITAGLFIDSHLRKVDDKEIMAAYAETQKAIIQASTYFSKGMDDARELQRFNRAVEEAEPMTKMTEAMSEVQKLQSIESGMNQTKMISKFTKYQPFKIK